MRDGGAKEAELTQRVRRNEGERRVSVEPEDKFYENRRLRKVPLSVPGEDKHGFVKETFDGAI